MLGKAPAAIATIMVSPIARDTASTQAATIPLRAAGTTIPNETSCWVSPKA